MTVEVHRHTDRVPTPWANGGGITYEVARWPDGPGDFVWRLSVAEVATEGPFSSYPGVDRTLVLLSGGMRLVIDDLAHELVPGSPIAFTGDSRVSAELTDGPTMDFNVMSRQGAVSATVEVVTGPEVQLDPAGGGWRAAFVLDGSWISLDQQLEAWDCVISDEPFTITGSGSVVRIGLTLDGPRAETQL